MSKVLGILQSTLQKLDHCMQCSVRYLPGSLIESHIGPSPPAALLTSAAQTVFAPAVAPHSDPGADHPGGPPTASSTPCYVGPDAPGCCWKLLWLRCHHACVAT
eukprot:GHUV01024615.1.p1 GENE.GHUV01024615.1~~GHUV01024615.1.p1  ORF type:complete len:104 (-),score=12.09 GHUV01024615.1:525-836(-)